MKRRLLLLFLIVLSSVCFLSAEDHDKRNEDGGDDEGIVLFHGKRMNSRHDVFRVMKVCVHERIVTVRFNMPVDPRSVNVHAVILDGRPLPPGTQFRFNREGMLVEIKLPPRIRPRGMIDVSGIRAFDGSSLQICSFDCSADGCRYSFCREDEEEHED